MIYTFFRYPLIFSLILLLTYSPLKAQGPDSVYIVPKTPFIAQLLAFKALNVNINLSKQNQQIPVHNHIIDGNAQELIKQGNDIYVFIEQTGFVYKLASYDSTTCVYKRMDKTVNLNYNIDCKNFIYQNKLYSYGGYGFWKTNGNLRKFNDEDREWDIIPLNKEVIATAYLWIWPEEGRMYLPFQ